MMETIVVLKPQTEWRAKARWYSNWPDFIKPVFRPFWPDTISWEELVNEMNARLTLPGQTNAWSMPIKNRIDMLTTGIRTPVGVKIFGSDLAEIEKIGQHLEGILQKVPGTRSVFGERVAGGYFVDFDLNREQIARYGLTIGEVQEVIMTAIGGDNVSTTVEGRERYPINIRYPREMRDDVDKLSRTLVSTMGGAQIPLGQLATIKLVEGPSMIRDEDGHLSGYVYVDIDSEKRDIGGYVEEAKKAVESQLKLKPGYLLAWSGQYESMARVKEKMKVVIPLTLFVVFMLIFLNTKSFPKTAIVLLAVPFSAVGAIWLLYALGYNMSIAVWVGLIALLGLDAETGIFMLLYLDLAHDERVAAGTLNTHEDLNEAILHGAVQARPAEGDDRRLRLLRSRADHVVDRRGRGRHEAHRRADDRRPLHVVPDGAARLSGDLSSLARTRSAASRTRGRRASETSLVATAGARERSERCSGRARNRRLHVLSAKPGEEGSFPRACAVTPEGR